MTDKRRWGDAWHRIGMAILSSASVVFGLIAPAAADGAADPLRFSASSNWGAPFAGYDDEHQLTGGLMFDIIQTIARDAGLSYRIVTLPRLRIDAAVEAGQIDVRCYARPEWTASPGRYLWSEPIFESVDRVVARMGEAKIDDYAAIAGQTVFTALGYRYPGAEAAFAAHRIGLASAPSEESVVRLVAAERVRFGIVNDITLEYIRHKDPRLFVVAATNLVVERNEILCGVARDLEPGRATAVLDAIRRLRGRGAFKHISHPVGSM